MAPLRITKHFISRWVQRVAPSIPTPEQIGALVAEADKVQPHRRLYDARGFPVTVLARYWHPGRGVVVVVDEFEAAAVTVYSEAAWRNKRRAA